MHPDPASIAGTPADAALDDAARCRAIRNALPSDGLFAGQEWRVSPHPLVLPAAVGAEFQRLGRMLAAFQSACNRLYLASAAGRMPAWIAQYLDAGKPPGLVAFARDARLRQALPAVIRPDLLLTAGGLRISELDSVPGGIGATTWLEETHRALGDQPGGSGMRAGWNAVFPEGDVVISQEAASYRPEMEWLNPAPGPVAVHDAESYRAGGRPIYRFFEAFDLPNLPRAGEWQEAVLGGLPMTAPLKTFLEEKLWFALFWMRPLQSWWRAELGEKTWLRLQQLIPFSWVLTPEPLPPHAVHPRLEIQSWEELAHFSQKQRRLVLKISGFSERAWGARGVVFGHDVSAGDWTAAVRGALADFERHPHVLQVFEESSLVETSWWNDAAGSVVPMKGRARLCPYYFMRGGEPVLGAVLVTVCPPDKKALHGMRDAVMTVATWPS
jgi:hypothetical protein